jgi:hypothetical protein
MSQAHFDCVGFIGQIHKLLETPRALIRKTSGQI